MLLRSKRESFERLGFGSIFDNHCLFSTFLTVDFSILLLVLAGLGTMLVAGAIHFYFLRRGDGGSGTIYDGTNSNISLDRTGHSSPSTFNGIGINTRSPFPPSVSSTVNNTNGASGYFPFFLTTLVKSTFATAHKIAVSPRFILGSIHSAILNTCVVPVHRIFEKWSMAWEHLAMKVDSSLQNILNFGLSLYCFPHEIYSQLSPVPFQFGSSLKTIFFSGFVQVSNWLSTILSAFQSTTETLLQSSLVHGNIVSERIRLCISNMFLSLKIRVLGIGSGLQSILHNFRQTVIDGLRYVSLIISDHLKRRATN